MKVINWGGFSAILNSFVTLMIISGVGFLEMDVDYPEVVLHFTLSLVTFTFVTFGHESGLINSRLKSEGKDLHRVLQTVFFSVLAILLALFFVFLDWFLL